MANEENKTLERYLETIANQMQSISASVSSMKDHVDTSVWVTLEEAAKMKGAVSYPQLRKKKWLMPCCGANYKYYGGKRVWSKELVLEWLMVTDDILEDYAAKYGVDISKWFRNGKAVQGDVNE